MIYGDPNSENLTKIESDPVKRQDAIESASARIDACLASSPEPYAVPMDTSGVTPAEEKDKLDALLAWLSESIAGFILSAGNAGSGQMVTKNYEDAEAWLTGICDGSRRLPPTAPRSSTSGSSFGVEGSVPRDFPDDLYATNKNLLFR